MTLGNASFTNHFLQSSPKEITENAPDHVTTKEDASKKIIFKEDTPSNAVIRENASKKTLIKDNASKKTITKGDLSNNIITKENISKKTITKEHLPSNKIKENASKKTTNKEDLPNNTTIKEDSPDELIDSFPQVLTTSGKTLSQKKRIDDLNAEGHKVQESLPVEITSQISASNPDVAKESPQQKHFTANRMTDDKIENLTTSNVMNSIPVNKSNDGPPQRRRPARYIRRRSMNRQPKMSPQNIREESPQIKYRKLYYSEDQHKWIEHVIIDEEIDPAQPKNRRKLSTGSRYERIKPHRVKGRRTSALRDILPTAMVKSDGKKRKLPYDKIEVTDLLRMELHKRKMPVVPSYFQEHIFKFGKLPFRGNPRYH